MSWLSNLFGGGSSTQSAPQLPAPPQLRLDDYDLFLQQVDGLINTYTNRSNGTDQFDFMKFLYDPQARQLDEQYGLGAPGALTDNPSDPQNNLFARSGAIPRALQQLNAQGLLDSGTAAVVRAQMESELANKKSDAFANAKILQRQDIDNALQNLNTLYPERFQVRNIPNILDYTNALSRYNVEQANSIANQLFAANKANSGSQMWGTLGGILGAGVGTLVAPGVGTAAGYQIGSSLGNSFSGNKSGSTGSIFNPQMFQSMPGFGATSGYSTPQTYSSPFSSSGFFSSSNNYSYNPVNAAMPYNGPSNISW